MGRGRQERRVQRSRRELVGHEASALTIASIQAVVFDFDGTLLDSDAALLAPFLELGVPAEDVRFGPLAAEECARLGLPLDDYLSRYDTDAAQPFVGIEDMLARLALRWSVCSNKVRSAGVAELRRLAWHPEVALFAEDFGGPKRLLPVLDAMRLAGSDVVFLGDTAHDRACAHAVGAHFALAGWNPRARVAARGDDTVLDEPADLLGLLGRL